MTTAYLDALYYAAATLLALTALWLIWRSLPRDRPRGRRCPKCWYDLRGTPGLRCSECGHTAKHERQLFNTRRRWRWALLGVTGVIGAGWLVLTPAARPNGWIGLAPTWPLLILAPSCADEAPYFPLSNSRPPPTSPFAAELLRRAALDSLSPSQLRYFLQQKCEIKTRARWPMNVPLVCRVQLPLWALPSQCDAHVIVVDGEPRPLPENVFMGLGGWETMGTTMNGAPRRVVADAPVRMSSKLETVWQLRRYTRPLSKTPLVLPVEIVKSLDQVTHPHSDPEINALMKEALQVKAFVGPDRSDGYDSITWTINFDRDRDPRLRTLAFGFRIVLERNGAEKVSAPVEKRWWPDMFKAPLAPDAARPDGMVTIRGISGADLKYYSSRWRLRIRGDGEMALRDWDYSEYWDGEFTLPLSEVLK